MFLRRRNRSSGGPEADGVKGLPISDYNGLKSGRVIARLQGLSQVELARIEDHERSHKGRQPVLDKLRYLRGREPLPGYDALDATQITEALAAADHDTLALVREYEQKFRRRDEVLDELARLRRERRAGHGG
jgi:hypothetical protein